MQDEPFLRINYIQYMHVKLFSIATCFICNVIFVSEKCQIRWVGRKSMKIWQTGILNFQIQSKVTDICILKQTDKAFYKRWNNPQCYNFLLTASGRGGGIKGEFLPVQHPIYITIHNLLKLNLTSLITWYLFI